MRKTMVVAVVVAAVAGFRAGASAQAVPAPATHAAQAPAVPVQAAQAAAEAPATQAPSAASLLHPSPVGAELLAPAPARAGAPERQMVHAPAYGRRNGLALMIAGGAAFLGGAIIGGDAGTALMVGGVVVGAVGLYQYLQ